jgi:hypothetical protein
MKCVREGCEAERAQECERCGWELYCSQRCRAEDAQQHSKLCGKGFRLEEFEDVKVGRKPKLLGKGSYGEVRLVRHIPTGTQFAFKSIPKEMTNSEDLLAVLRREISVHEQLRHPNIVRLYGSLEDQENFYLVLEYAAKGNLYTEVRKNRGLPEGKAKDYFTQVCRGIQYLHERLVVHRDLKPENLVLSSKEEVKICDFGWCVEGLEMRSTFCGTVDYMAPEMIRGKGHSFSVDVWALGVLLYEMIHGVAPWTAKRDKAKTEQIVGLKYKCREGINPLIGDLIGKILRQNPEERPSASQIFLHPWMQDAPLVAPAPKSEWLGMQLPPQVSNEEEKAVSIGDIHNYYLKGFGMAEGLVTDIKAGFCTLYFEVNSSYQQVPISKLAALQSAPPADPSQAAEIVPVVEPEIIQPPLKLRPEDEAEIQEKINRWCHPPPPPPDNPRMRELDESRRRLESALAALQDQGNEEVQLPPQQVYRAAQPMNEKPIKQILQLEQPLKLPSFLLDQEEIEDQPKPKRHHSRKMSPKPVPILPNKVQDDWLIAHHAPKPDPLQAELQSLELEQRLAKYQEDLKRLAEEVEKPELPRVRKKTTHGVLGWLGGLFK